MTFSAWCLLHRKTARFSSNSRNGRVVVFVYRFGAIFRGNTAAEPPQNSPWYYGQGRLCPVKLLCFGIVSVFIFAGSLCCRSCPRFWRRFPPLGTLVAVRGSSVSLPEVVALHRRGAYPIQAGHSIGIIHR